MALPTTPITSIHTQAHSHSGFSRVILLSCSKLLHLHFITDAHYNCGIQMLSERESIIFQGIIISRVGQRVKVSISINNV